MNDDDLRRAVSGWIFQRFFPSLRVAVLRVLAEKQGLAHRIEWLKEQALVLRQGNEAASETLSKMLRP